MKHLSIAKKLHVNKLVVAFVAVTTVAVMGFGSVASAAPDYFDVEKPTSRSVCYGGSWESGWSWGGWWGWHREKHWEANWEKLGFKSFGQCIRYVSTTQPESRKDCREAWWWLGFKNQNHCVRYLRLHPGNGYGA